MGNYRVFGPVRVCVSLCVCLSVRLTRFSAALAVRGAILGSMVGYGPQTNTIDFGVNQCIFKVTGCKDRQGSDCSILLKSVRLTRFSAALAVRGAILSSMVGYGPQTSTIDFGVNRCILKVKGYKNIAFTISGHSSSLWIDIKIVLF